jgi:uncharacterized protein (PEP-CTERM system associated)
MVKAGGQYNDPYNDPVDDSGYWDPYAQASLSYRHAAGSVNLSFQQIVNQTDEISSDASGKITQNQETSVIMLSGDYQITPKLTAGVSSFAQFSTFNGGANDGDTDQLYGVDLTLSYSFTKHFFADFGYHYTTVDSDVTGRGYDRNIVSLGVTAVY